MIEHADRLYLVPGIPIALQREITILALCVWGEARGEAYEGKRAVAHVIMNRYRQQTSKFGYTVKDVVLKPKQFSCFNVNDPNYKKMQQIKVTGRDEQLWSDCVGAAWDAYSGVGADPTKGADHYHADWMETYPKWAKAFKQTAKIGQHIFYKS